MCDQSMKIMISSFTFIYFTKNIVFLYFYILSLFYHNVFFYITFNSK